MRRSSSLPLAARFASASLVVAAFVAAACGGGKEPENPNATPARSGGLSPDQVRVSARANAEQILACRDRGDAGRGRTAEGVVHVAWTIAMDGRVHDARVVESSVNDPDVEACVVAAVERFSFPPSTAPTVVARLPFTIGPAPAENEPTADAGAPRDAGAKRP